MPFIIRIIIQRALLFLYSILLFFGIAPESQILDQQQAQIAIEERKEAISSLFETDNEQGIIKIEKEINLVDEIDKKITDLAEKINPKTDDNIVVNLKPENTIEISEKEVKEIIENSDDDFVTNSKYDIDEVVVNIVCSRENGNFINISTGSGVIVDPSGIILTNAHVGQFVLLEDYSEELKIKCSVYQENAPTFGYYVDVLYISPRWIIENFELINAENPKGTGENDYAFLYIAKNTNPGIKRPTKFPYSKISISEKNYEIGNKVSVAGYPGAPKNILELAKAGRLREETTSIIDVYTFNRYSIDLITADKTFVGSKGSSGGGVFRNGNLIGVISTTNGSSKMSELNAITTFYINNDLKSESGKNIEQLLKSELIIEIKNFGLKYGKTLSRILSTQLD